MAKIVQGKYAELYVAVKALNELSRLIHKSNVEAGWWTDPFTEESLLGKDENGRDKRNVPEVLALVHSEISEALEAYRKNLMDDKLTHRSGFEVELADTLYRIFDLSGAHNLDLAGALYEKFLYNQTREDHKMENRKSANGKRF